MGKMGGNFGLITPLQICRPDLGAFIGHGEGEHGAHPPEENESRASSSRPQKLVNRDRQSIGQFLDVVDRDIARATLDVCHESPMQFRLQGQIFLRHLPFRAQTPQVACQHVSR
jgi:hypothetical protein